MNTILLDGRKMLDKITAHVYLQKKLQLPGYLGNNLDALWDALSANDRYLHITLIHGQAMITNLGNYGTSLKKVFEDAAAEKAHVIFIDIEKS